MISFPGLKVDSVIAGKGNNFKSAVRVATISPISIPEMTAGSSIDGVTLVTGDRVLVKNQNPLSEIIEITTLADSSGSLSGKYFKLYSAANSYAVYFNTGSSPSPNLANHVNISVDILENDSANSVAEKLATRIALLEFSTNQVSNSVEITVTSTGPVKRASDVDTGFTFSILQYGTNGAENIVWQIQDSGGPVPAIDFDLGESVASSVISVSAGTINQDTVWTCINDSPNDVSHKNILIWKASVNSIIKNKGDILSHNSSDLTRLAISENNYVLTADSSADTGLTWSPNTKPFSAIVAAGSADYSLISEAFAAGATSVFVKAGTYTETGNIVIPNSGKIIGEPGSVIDFSNLYSISNVFGSRETGGSISISNSSSIVTGTGTSFLNISIPASLEISGIFYSVSAINNNTELILAETYLGTTINNSDYVLQNTANIEIQDLKFINMAGFELTQCQDSRFENISADFIKLTFCGSCKILASNFKSASVGVFLNSCFSCEVSCEVINSTTGIQVSTGSKNNKISKCWLNSNSTGISDSGDSVICQNHFVNCATGILAASGSLVSENICSNCGTGISVIGDSVNINSNIVRNNNTGIEISGSFCICSGNRALVNLTGIAILAGAVDTVYLSNSTLNNVNFNFTDAGTITNLEPILINEINTRDSNDLKLAQAGILTQILGNLAVSGAAVSGYSATINSAGNGLIISAGSGSNIAARLSNSSNSDLLEITAAGNAVFGNSYSQTQTNNTSVYGIDNQFSTSELRDINTQFGIYRIAGNPITRNTYFKDSVDMTESSTTSDIFQNKVSLTQFVPAGIYRVGWSFAIAGSGQQGNEFRITVDEEDIGTGNGTDLNNSGFTHEGGFYYKEETIDNTIIINIDYRSLNGETHIKEAKLEVWRI